MSGKGQRTGHQIVSLSLLQRNRNGETFRSGVNSHSFELVFTISELFKAHGFHSVSSPHSSPAGDDEHGSFLDARPVSAMWWEGVDHTHLLHSVSRIGHDQERKDGHCNCAYWWVEDYRKPIHKSALILETLQICVKEFWTSGKVPCIFHCDDFRMTWSCSSLQMDDVFYILNAFIFSRCGRRSVSADGSRECRNPINL